MIQQDTLPEEYERLKQGKALQRNSRILKLDPYFDKKSRTLRVKGRLQNSDLPETTKHPIIVPHGHPLTEKIINRKHQELLHAGPEMTLSALRQNIWLTKGRREVKRVINRCITCQRQRKSCSTQKMGQLPHERVSFSPPFTHRDNTVKKTYLCIFRCASSRMVHLELTKDMSTSEFLQVFNRMIGRRGLCETMWSDNAQTFKSAERKIRKLYSSPTPNLRHLWSRINRDELMAQLSSKGIKWKFIVERAPWQVGGTEWYVRLKNLSVKC